MTDDKLYSLSDEELERAFLDAKENEQYSDVDEPVTESIDTYEEEDIEIMEQPDELDEDSVDEGATDDEVTTETESTEVTAQPDEEVATEDEDPIEDVESEEDINDEIAQKEQQELVFKANGREFKFTQDEMLEQFPKIFGQAMDYTKKTQAMKPWRKTIDAIEQAKLGHDEINLAIDVLRGDRNAIAEVIKRAGIDTLELDTENSKYVPKDYGRDDNTLAIKDVVDEISADKEYEVTHRVLSKDWDDNSFREMTKDPELIKLLHMDVKSGMYDKVQPIAEKLKVFDRGRQSDLDYYKAAAGEYFRELSEETRRAEAIEQQRLAREAKIARQAEVERVKVAQVAREKVAEKVEQRKAAAPVRSNAGTKKVVDYLDDSDEGFEEWYKQMESKR